MPDASLYDHPDLYDLVSPRDPDMERFYVQTARATGASVLELACGPGRITIPLAAAGLDATGGDLSTTMLEAARQSAAAQGQSPRFVALDMRNFDLGRRFDTIIVAANSLLHLHTAEDFAGFFGSVGRHLTSNGRFAFDIFVPSMQMLARDPAERHPLGAFAHRRLGEVKLEETIDYDPVTQISRVTWFWSTAIDRDFWQTPLALRQIFPEELPSLLAANGFHLTDRFGDFDRVPFGSGFRQVCIAASD